MEKLLNKYSEAESLDAIIQSAERVKAHAAKHPMSLCTLSQEQHAIYNKAILTINSSEGEIVMTKTSHTPGPWEINDNQKISGASRTIIIADIGRPIPERFKVAHDEYEANARLIAAAPDYFDGCKDLPQIIDGESTTDYDKRVLAWFYSNAGKIHSANNKAKGE